MIRILLDLPLVFWLLIVTWAALAVLAVVVVHTCVAPLEDDQP